MKTGIKDRENKIAALQRNFESISKLCMKAESEKKNLEIMNSNLKLENRKYANEILGYMQQIKSLRAELE